ncbi:FAD-binding domain-containing protein [Melanomma pulvis-pyrius CBS 109.77]|uniref:FAD-binding domain-containing protein n=1 Tax=Melanomma pulvis-pyrius CBS 109.77 TaxID=1314802 RepID=A0A6A6XKS0_9PLEO|nr:FAD-binding domain-containing protein [Melanomma pulvis-pyrius CBS 109.77]
MLGLLSILIIALELFGVTSAFTVAEVCQQLQKKFSAQILTPGSSNYTDEVDAYWSLAAWLEPPCVFTPANTQELADGVKILVKTNTTFAVRSGGHAPVTGLASTNHGVLIAMTHFTEKKIVGMPNALGAPYFRNGAANRWGEVYEYLEPHGLAVVGGRIWPVGSALLLGGGISYFSQQKGWASNNVVNYELVTASGSILQVNAKSYPDLFWALKGSSNNFGIVTRYDLKTHKQGKIFGFDRAWAPTSMSKFSEAMTSWMAPGGGHEDKKGALMPSTQYTPASDRLDPSLVAVYDAPVENPAAFKNFTDIANFTDLGTGVQNLTSLVRQTIGYQARVFRWKWYVTSIKFSNETMPIVIDTMVDVAKELIPQFNGFVGTAEEPITADHLAAARANGGDPMDLDPANGGVFFALYYAAYTDPADDDKAENYLQTLISRVESTTKAKGLYYPYYFFNNLGIKQEPFKFYGGGKSLPKLKIISKKYDPLGVFQKLVPGFKLGTGALDGA